MLGLLKRAIRALFCRDDMRWMRDLDIQEGTRISPRNIESMFPRLVHIGRNCVFAPGSILLTHDASWLVLTGEYRIAPVYVGDNVFVGYGAIVLPGVRIGSNVIVGAGSVVTRDVPDDSVVAGVPAKVICSIAEFRGRRRPEEMFQPPYAGKVPDKVTEADVQAFREQVYRRLNAKDYGPET